MGIILGCIADDFTGATDLANTLVKYGMRTVQLIGVPTVAADTVAADAVVVALKSRTIAADAAIAESLAALQWLQKAGCRQFFFKYCSTFDSTTKGNIGPVAEALLAALDSDFTIACPAFPETGRTIYKGYLFVGDVLLNQSGMQNHPLTPMTDANLVNVLAEQSQGKVGLVQYRDIQQGVAAIAHQFDLLRTAGCRFAITDALTDIDLESIATACMDLPLLTGGSGIALGLPQNYRRKGWLKSTTKADVLPKITGKEAVISGSCSVATLAQINYMKQQCPSLQIDPLSIAAGTDVVAGALSWAEGKIAAGPVLIYASAEPQVVQEIQARLGREQAGELVEQALAGIARGLAELGVRRFVIAGGETSGAVVNALNVTGLQIGPQIDPGVPWTVSLGKPAFALALKSGNFGATDFFLKAFSRLTN